MKQQMQKTLNKRTLEFYGIVRLVWKNSMEPYLFLTKKKIQANATSLTK